MDTKRTKTRAKVTPGQPARLADDVLGEPAVTALRYHRLSDERDANAKQDTRTQRKADSLGATVLATHSDDEITAAYDPVVDDEPEYRPGFEALLEDIKRLRPTYVITLRPSRLTRNAIDSARFESIAAKARVVVVTERRNFDMTDAADRSALRRHADDDANYVAAISEGLMSANADRRELGMPKVGGPRPYGFEPDRVTPKRDEARVIRWLAERILAADPATLSVEALARELNAKGTPPPAAATANPDRLARRKRDLDGLRWGGSTITKLLARYSTAGLLEYDGELVGEFAPVAAGKVAPILDRETWQRVNDKLAARHYSTRRPPKTDGHYFLVGLLYCHCGGRMWGHIETNKRRREPVRRVYRCEHAAHVTIGADDARGYRGETVLGVESVARDVMLDLGSDPDHMAGLAEAAAERSREWHDAHELVEKLERDLDALADGRDPETGEPLSPRFANKRAHKVERELDAAERARKALDATPADALDKVRAQARDNLARAWAVAAPDRRRAMLAAVVGGLRVLPAGRGQWLPPTERVELIARH